MAVKKKDRFEIFKRDEFRCVYCNRQPPEVTLVIEHVTPKAKGGQDVFDNYCTSCVECNQGKGARLLTALPPSATDRMIVLQERLEEIEAFRAQAEMAQRLKAATEALREELRVYWCTSFEVSDCSSQIISMMLNRLKWIPLTQMCELIDCCAAKTAHTWEKKQSKYMAGILRVHLGNMGIDYKKEVGAA